MLRGPRCVRVRGEAGDVYVAAADSQDEEHLVSRNSVFLTPV